MHLIQLLTGSLVALGMVFLIGVAAELIPVAALPSLCIALLKLLIRGCYATGLAIGEVYKRNLQSRLNWLAIRLMAFSITLVVVGFEAIGSTLQQPTKQTLRSIPGLIPAN